MTHIPLYTGDSPLGCSSQVHKARVIKQTIEQVDIEIARVNIDMGLTPRNPLCACRIAENGCIDTSDCCITHTLYPIPRLARWCDQTTSRIKGGGYLLFLTGWARPSAMSLWGLDMTVDSLIAALSRCNRRTKHTNMKFVLRSEARDGVSRNILSYEQITGCRGKQLLAELPANVILHDHDFAVRE